MIVTIDGVQYLPASAMGANADEKAKAVIRMLISGYYNSVDCSVTGAPVTEPNHCECSACHTLRTAVQFLGSVPKSEVEPALIDLLRATAV
jgi:hypothetical protein